MTLTTSIAATTKSLALKVTINGVLLPMIQTANPFSATGTPAIAGFRITNRIGEAPTCSLELSRVPTWIDRGATITVDVGYDNLTRRRFTGTIQDRSKGIGSGTVNCIGRSSPLYGTAILPTQDYTGQTTATALANLLTYIGIDGTMRSITTTRSDVAEFTMGTASTTSLQNMTAIQMAQYIMELQGCKVFETGSGMTTILVIDDVPATTAIKTYTTNDNTTARIMTSNLREDPTYTRTRVKVSGATPTSGTTLTATAQVGGVSPLVKPALPSGSYRDAGIFNSLADTQAKVNAMSLFYLTQWHRVPKYLDIDIPGDPELECAATIKLTIPEQDIDGYFFIDGWEDTLSEGGGYRTTLSGLRGGDDLGGTLSIAPIAAFTMQPEREVFGSGATTFVFVTLDASASFDPDGSLTGTYTWTSNKTTTPTMASSTAKTRTVGIDSASLDGTGTDWTITLSVTDNSGASTSVTLTVPYATGGTLVTIPAMGLAYSTGVGYSPDGGQTWNDTTGATCVSVDVRPANGVNSGHILAGFSNGVIKRSTDGGLTFSTVYTAAAGVSINDVQFDWRNSLAAWAVDENANLYVSLDAGATWGVYAALRTVLSGVSGALGNKIGMPIAGGIYVFGGNGNGTPMIAYDANISGAWVNQILLGDIATDFPADATCRIVDFSAPGMVTSAMILSFASGGGGSIQPIYASTSPPGTSTTWTRATGLTAGLKNGRYIVQDTPARGDGFFYAAFGDQDIWGTSNGIAWSKSGLGTMPAGVTPNHGIYAAGVLTGLPDLTGLYLIAAENAAGTLGLYKSTDGMQTITALRPAGGSWPAWPTSGTNSKGKKVSVGAPVATSQQGNYGQLLITGRYNGDANTKEYGWRTSTNWHKTEDATNLTSVVVHRAICINSTNWFIGGTTSTTFSTGLISTKWVYTTNGGTSYSALAAPAANYWWHDFAQDGNNLLYGIARSNNNASSAGDTRLYKSTDHGANWTLVNTITDTNAGTGLNGLYRMCIAPTNPNLIALMGMTGSTDIQFVINYSNDAGATFTRTRSTTPGTISTANAWAMECKFLTTGRIVINIPGNLHSYIFTTDDGGATLTQRLDFGAYASSHHGIGLVGNDLGSALYAVDEDQGIVYSCPDQGVTWTAFSSVPSNAVTKNCYGIAYDGTALYLFMDTGSATNSQYIWRMAPISSTGTWADVTGDLVPWLTRTIFDLQNDGGKYIAVIP